MGYIGEEGKKNPSSTVKNKYLLFIQFFWSVFCCYKLMLSWINHVMWHMTDKSPFWATVQSCFMRFDENNPKISPLLTAQSNSAVSLDAVQGYVATAVAMTSLISPTPLGKFPPAAHLIISSSEKPTPHVCCHKIILRMLFRFIFQ